MFKLILFIAVLLACMVYIWFRDVAVGWKIAVDVWCAWIIWMAIEMRISPVIGDDGKPVKKAKKTEDKEGIEWGAVRP